jgi:hypothetical protein
MSGLLYYLATAGDSVLSVFGMRAQYEAPKYEIVGHVPPDIEIRAYPARVAVETQMRMDNDGEAFGRLFRYITGANQASRKIAMTVPVQMEPQRIAMTLPVQTGPAEQGSEDTMRFFLPRAVAEAGPPTPTDPLVHLVHLPPQRFAVLRFSGRITEASRREHTDALLRALRGAGAHIEGAASVLSYDPPFTPPFLRRNEVAVPVEQ